MKFKESGGAMAASGALGAGVHDVADAAFGLAESGVDVGSPPTSSAAGVGSGDVNSDVVVSEPPDNGGAGSSRRGLGQPNSSDEPSPLDVLFADLAAARAVLAEHSLSSLLNDNERASIISARVRVDEVLAAISEAGV